MSSLNKCKNCGSSDLDVDPARGDTVCTNCGTVLEDSVIVSEIQFEENAHGGTSALGHFVSSDSKGGCQGFGGALRGGLSRESREITLDNCKKTMGSLCNQLRLNQHCLETSFNFYKMALSRQLTKGRRQILVCAACVYMTCRLEGTSHLLIDFSELLQICIYELGRTYLRLSHALYISIPSIDPCLYVLRYANRLELGPKTHEVTMTALRILQRMKKDMLHSGRRPNALIGAALLMAARWHDFNRSVSNIIKVVRTTETTLKKRLLEFGDTPSSGLTLEEFMNVDLEEEQDPPAYKMIRKKDSERVQKMIDDENEHLHFVQLRKIIEKKLDEGHSRRKGLLSMNSKMSTSARSSKRKHEEDITFPGNLNINPRADDLNDVDEFIKSTELPSVIKKCLEEGGKNDTVGEPCQGMEPTPEMLGMVGPDRHFDNQDELQEENETIFDDLEDSELDAYVLTPLETENKAKLWDSLFKEYLEQQAIKKAKEEAEGKKEKKKRKPKSNKSVPVAKTPQEAIERMLKEKKISNKINYDVLKSLDVGAIMNPKPGSSKEIDEKVAVVEPIVEKIIKVKETKSKLTKDMKIKVEIKEEPTTVSEEVKDKRIDDYYEEDDFEEERDEEEEQTLSSMFSRKMDEEDYDEY